MCHREHSVSGFGIARRGSDERAGVCHLKLLRYLLIGVFALLQAAAPLLHAHMGADRGAERAAPQGLHLHLGVHAASSGDMDHVKVSDPLQPDSTAIGVGQELRRDFAWHAQASACLVLVLCVPLVQRMPPPRPADLAAHLPALPAFLAPPPQGPPAASA